MKQMAIIFAMLAATITAQAQTDSTTFRGRLFNDEYELFLQIDFYKMGVSVPQHEVYGELPGYVGRKRNSFVWLITDAQITGEKTATLELINDYGSEDLTATLTQLTDSTYQLRQVDGSTLKMPRNGKWQKIPKSLTLKRKLR